VLMPPAVCRLEGRAAGNMRMLSSPGGPREVWLMFDCPLALRQAEEVLFSYAPGYTRVSIRKKLLVSMDEVVPQPSSLTSWPGHAQQRSQEDLVELKALRTSVKDVAEKASPVVEDFQITSRNTTLAAGKPQHPGRVSLGKVRVEALLTTLETRHDQCLSVLAVQLQEVQALSDIWEKGDTRALVQVLESHPDDVRLYHVLEGLAQHSRPIQVKALSRLLVLAQSLAQSKCEEHAVAAMRFVMQALKVSWPPAAKALLHVATSRQAREACEELGSRFSSIFALVKSMARSVRISQSSGPLIPTCRKLKTALEEALVVTGHVRRSSITNQPTNVVASKKKIARCTRTCRK